ncbi:hypothetical protein [Bdellovibrio bacteriovorus]|uniref:hypothetical protein n=1 Tax=Bdellovibrio bacteriovorus TaxID=959 RepID=UPI001E2873B4|nr:hypothetical protein [Bdellovibrio bacteriovorus]
MNLISKKSLVLAAFLSMTACAGQDYSSAEVLPDDTEMEQTIPETEPVDKSTAAENETASNEDTTTVLESEAILKNYDHLDPKRLINSKALAEAVVYFDKNQSRISKTKNTCP